MSRTQHQPKRHKWPQRTPGTRSDRRPARRKDPPTEPECFICDGPFRRESFARKKARYMAREGERQLAEIE